MGANRAFAIAAAGVVALGLPAAAQEAPGATCDAPPQLHVMPTTGLAFSLPPDSNTADCPPAPVRPVAPDLFRMAALPIGSNPSLAKWEHARGAALGDTAGPWSEMLSQANRVTRGNPFVMVNTWVNWRVRYRADTTDRWNDAETTLRRGYGDCEDFAIAKMALLAALGVATDDMVLVVLRDARQAEHAVLAVRRSGSFFILDNRTDKLVAAELVTDYTPVMAFSGPFAWTYGKRPG